ncbi:hypothetical protein [Aeromonas salmonicida]|uniref:hypothetical protein n=1 Tax=Aeromonas salmonicida TaxID=645 RepID=UPI001F3D37F3|nr:hypothetical protein [Aeromonas salmonicida]
MSDAIKIARQAPKLIEGLLADMFAARAEDNRICLGGLHSGQQYIQIHLVATSNPATLMDDGDEEGDDGLGSVPVASHLSTHWLTARAEFIGAREAPWMQTAELLALGAIRSIYWQALGQGETALATEIGDWWKESAPLHEQGEVIR